METDGTTIPDTSFNAVDFGSGKRQKDGILSVRWRWCMLKIQKDWMYSLTIERDGYIFTRQRFKKNDKQLLIWVERMAKDISNGRYTTKKPKKR